MSGWIASIGLDPNFYGTHSLRRAKATRIYRPTGNLRAVQLSLGYRRIEGTVRYLGIDVDDALAIAAGGRLKYLGRADMLCLPPNGLVHSITSSAPMAKALRVH